MTHLGLSWLLEIPSNSHFTMQNGSVLDKGVTVREHLGEKGTSVPIAQDILEKTKEYFQEVCFFSEGRLIVTYS